MYIHLVRVAVVLGALIISFFVWLWLFRETDTLVVVATSAASNVEETVDPTPTVLLETAETGLRYKASAVIGDFIEVTIQDTSLTYVNRTNGWSGTDVPLIMDEDGYLTFGNDPNLILGRHLPGSFCMFHTATAGKTSNQKAFILGLAVRPYTEASFPQRMLNYMQFRVNNGGFEVGYIDATADEIKHRHYGPVWAGNPEGGLSEETSFAVDATTFTLSEDRTYLSKTFVENGGESNDVTIFQTMDDDVVLDMNNGSIVAFSQRADNTLPTGVYTGLLFGRDDAQSLENNTETGTDLLIKVCITLQEDGTFLWQEDGITLFEGAGWFPMHESLAFGHTLHGIFHYWFSSDAFTNDELVIILSADGNKMLCGRYHAVDGEATYAYRHGAAALDL
jgi:hypothetical protein